jgi:hypothetical protein
MPNSIALVAMVPTGLDPIPARRVRHRKRGRGGGVIKEKNRTKGEEREDRYIDSTMVFIWERQRGMMVELKQNSIVGERT